MQMFWQQRKLKPGEHPAAFRGDCIVRLDSVFGPLETSIIFVVRQAAHGSVVHLVGAGEEEADTRRSADHVGEQLEHQLVSLFVTERCLVVVAIGSQLRKLRMLEYVFEMRGALHDGNDLDKAPLRVSGKFL